jgi:N-acetylglutamate synthase-like GNAT family acetyltransferase
MRIKKYNSKDKEKVKSLLQSVLFEIYGKHKIEWENFNDYLIFYIAEEKNKIIGTSALKKVDDKIIRLKRMYVNKNFRKKGIGKELLLKCEIFSKNKGFKKIVLSTNKEMKLGINFYLKNGFVVVKSQSSKFFTNKDLIDDKIFIMEKNL